MTVRTEEELVLRNLHAVAAAAVTAARTAPKGRGQNNLFCAVLEGDDIRLLADKMREIADREQMAFFKRDADNVLASPLVLLLGTRIRALGLKKCGFCGFADCEEKNRHPNVPCVINTTDLGIAIGSAASIATDHRIDNRIMYSIGLAALELGLMGAETKIAFGIPLSATSKSPFFDRNG